MMASNSFVLVFCMHNFNVTVTY